MERVRAVKLQTLMSLFGITVIDLLKLDVEGAEREILSESFPWRDRVGAFAIELHDRLRPGCSLALEQAASGFHRCDVPPLTEVLINPDWPPA
jgi:hypothetical protein